MQKKSIFTILGVMLAVVVTSLTLVFAVGPMVSGMTEHGGILVLSDWEDFDIDDEGIYYYWPGETICHGLSTEFLCDVLGYYKDGCGDFHGSSEKLLQYDEIHIVIPEGVTCLDGTAFDYFWIQEFGYKVTSITIPNTVTRIGRWAFEYCNIDSIVIPSSVEYVGECAISDCYNLSKVYCECSEADAAADWHSEWFANDVWINGSEECVGEVIWNCNKTITFNTNGGNETITNQTICVDHYVSKPTDPTRENYVFQYWYTTDENTPFDFENEQVIDNMTLTAKWEAVATQNNENQNQENNQNNETANNEVASAEKKNNPLMAWIGGGIAAGLSVICGVAIVVAKKRRK